MVYVLCVFICTMCDVLFVSGVYGVRVVFYMCGVYAVYVMCGCGA